MKRIKAFSMALALGVGACGSAHAVELLTNGDFETGTLAGWTVTDLAGGSGTWYVDTPGTTTPQSFQPTSAAGGSPHGAFYAVSDQSNPGTHALTQAFTWAGGGSLTLTFDMFANDWSSAGPIADPIGLDHTGGPNQHVRVDVLTAAAPAFDTAGGVVQSILAPMVDPAGTNPNPFTSYLFDLSGLAAGTYQLRFAEVDNLFFFNMGVDNVSLQAEAVPAPSVAVLLVAGLAAVGCASWRRRR